MAHSDAPHTPAPATEPTQDTHMSRGECMQHLHALVNSYAEMWDEHRDPKATEPTTLKTWLGDFEKYLQKQSQPPQH